MTQSKQRLIGSVFAIITEFLFGFSYLFTKQVTDSYSALTLLSWRFITGFIFLSLCGATGIIKLRLRHRHFGPLLGIAILQPILYYVGETLGISLTSTSESSAVIASIPIVTLICSALILKEKPTRNQTIGICVTVSGVLTIVLAKGLQTTFNVLGYLMLCLAVVTYSLYSVASQKTDHFTSAEKTYVMTGLGAFTFTAFSLIEHARAHTLLQWLTLPFDNRGFLIAILYLGLGCTVLAFLLYNSALTYIGANRAVSFVGISTIVTVIAGVGLLHEQITLPQIIGTLMVLGGVYVANFVKKTELAS